MLLPDCVSPKRFTGSMEVIRFYGVAFEQPSKQRHPCFSACSSVWTFGVRFLCWSRFQRKKTVSLRATGTASWVSGTLEQTSQCMRQQQLVSFKCPSDRIIAKSKAQTVTSWHG